MALSGKVQNRGRPLEGRCQVGRLIFSFFCYFTSAINQMLCFDDFFIFGLQSCCFVPDTHQDQVIFNKEALISPGIDLPQKSYCSVPFPSDLLTVQMVVNQPNVV